MTKIFAVNESFLFSQVGKGCNFFIYTFKKGSLQKSTFWGGSICWLKCVFCLFLKTHIFSDLNVTSIMAANENFLVYQVEKRCNFFIYTFKMSPLKKFVFQGGSIICLKCHYSAVGLSQRFSWKLIKLLTSMWQH